MENSANAYMSTPVVRAALETGIDRNVVQLVTARRIAMTGTPYDNPNALIEACMDYVNSNESGNKNITPLTETSPNSFPMEVKQSNFEARQQRSPIFTEPGPSTSQMENSANAYMFTPVVRAALETGIDRNVVQLVTARRIELTGTPYDNPNALIEACIDYPYNNGSGNKNITPLSETSPNLFPMKVKQGISLAIPSASTLKVQPKSEDMSIEDENMLLKEMRLCKICMEEEAGIVFLPCGHLISCLKCSRSLKHCPMCRKEISGKVKTFLS